MIKTFFEIGKRIILSLLPKRIRRIPPNKRLETKLSPRYPSASIQISQEWYLAPKIEIMRHENDIKAATKEAGMAYSELHLSRRSAHKYTEEEHVADLARVGEPWRILDRSYTVEELLAGANPWRVESTK